MEMSLFVFVKEQNNGKSLTRSVELAFSLALYVQHLSVRSMPLLPRRWCGFSPMHGISASFRYSPSRGASVGSLQGSLLHP